MTGTATESQEAIRALATDLFGRQVDPARIDKVEATGDRIDRDLWSSVADAGLIGVAVPDDAGGLGLGMTELALVAEQLGRAVAPIPLPDGCVAAWFLATHGAPEQRDRWVAPLVTGTAMAAVAVPRSTVGLRESAGRLNGTAVAVPWAHVADILLLPVGDRVVAVDPHGPGVTTAREETTARQIALTMRLDDAAAETVGTSGDAARLIAATRVALSAVQAGITAAAVRLTASYTSGREQFGKPLSTFQSVALKAADAYLDSVAIRAAVFQAAEALDAGGEAELEVLTAAWWAADGGQHCVHLTQHLHGGMGADVTYPVHRYFLWAKQIELMLGGASALLADVGDALDRTPDAGDAIQVG